MPARSFALIVLAAVAAVASSGPASASGTSATPAQLRAYLASMAPPVKQLTRVENSAFAADSSDTNLPGTPSTTPDADLKVARQLSVDRRLVLRLAARIARIRPPTDLREPHADLVQSAKLDARMFAINAQRWTDYSDGTQAGADAFYNLGNKATLLLDRIQTLEIHWPEEVIFQLRHAGMSVPLWVEEVADCNKNELHPCGG